MFSQYGNNPIPAGDPGTGGMVVYIGQKGDASTEAYIKDNDATYLYDEAGRVFRMYPDRPIQPYVSKGQPFGPIGGGGGGDKFPPENK